MKKFKYLSPNTLEEAVSLYGSHNGNVKYIAGGTDVIIKIKEGYLLPDYLISLKKVPDFDTIHKDKNIDELHIGTMVTHRTLETSPVVLKDYPIIYDAVTNIGSLQVRNIATIGGNIVNAVPSAEGAIPLIVLDAKAFYVGSEGEKSIDLIDFFKVSGETVLKDDEILTKLVLPRLEPHTGSAYCKFDRRAAMELPIIGIGILLSLDDKKEICTKARIGLGVAAPTPMRAVNAEKFLEGKKIDAEILTEAGVIAADESQVRDSARGKAWFKKEMIKVQVKRMGLQCIDIINSRK